MKGKALDLETVSNLNHADKNLEAAFSIKNFDTFYDHVNQFKLSLLNES